MARTKGRFWSIRPAKLLLPTNSDAADGHVFTVYGILLPAMGRELAALVWGYALASLVVTDFLKILYYGRLNRKCRVSGTKKVEPPLAYHPVG